MKVSQCNVGMRQCITVSSDVTASIVCDMDDQPEKVRQAIKDYPFMGTAALVTSMMRPTSAGVNVYEFLNVAGMLSLLDKTLKGRDASDLWDRGPIDMTSLVVLLQGRFLPFDVLSFNILTGLLPGYNGDRSYKFRAGGGRATLTCTHTMKKSGVHYEVHFSGDGGVGVFPMTVRVLSYCDMDRLVNHSEFCPQLEKSNLEEELKDDSLPAEERKSLVEALNKVGDSDCSCESFVTNDNTVNIHDNEWDDGKGADVVRRWIEREIFKGHHEGDVRDEEFSPPRD